MKTNAAIPRRLRDKVDRELESGDQTQWIDMPIPRFFTPFATASFLFGIPWTASAAFWMYGAAGFGVPDFNQGGPPVFPLFGLPFILVGLAMLAAPLWAYRKAFKTVYVVTDRRAITFDGGWSMTIRSYPPAELQNVYRNERANGSGDVIIARRAWRTANGARQSEELGFLRVRQAKDVERLLRDLAQTQPGTHSH